MKSNSLRDIWTVAKFTMRDMVSRKSFRISTIIILVLIVLGFNIPNIINDLNGGEGFTDTIVLVDRDHFFGENIKELDNNNILIPGANIVVEQADDDTIAERIQNDEISSAIIINKDPERNSIKLKYLVKNTATASHFPTDTLHALQDLHLIEQLEKHGFTEKEISTEFLPAFTISVEQVEDKQIGGNIGIMMILSVLLFFAIYFCAFQVSSSITIEKTSKIMETLVTSTSPRSIILGKTIGVGIVGLLQIMLFVITAIFSANAFLDPELLSNLVDLSNFTPYLALIALAYFILGYFAYALLYAVTGSTVAKPEDIQAANTPVVIVTMVGFYFSYFTLLNPTSSLATIAALLPISSPFCMPLRVMMGIASGWEVFASIAILLIFCAIVAHIAIKIYSNAILNYGSRMTLSDIIKSYKEK